MSDAPLLYQGDEEEEEDIDEAVAVAEEQVAAEEAFERATSSRLSSLAGDSPPGSPGKPPLQNVFALVLSCKAVTHMSAVEDSFRHFQPLEQPRRRLAARISG